MATEICLCIEDDGTMTIEAGEKEEVAEVEGAEGGQNTPVKSLEEALGMIKQLAEQASIAAPEGQMQEDPAMAMEDPAAGQEDAAMQESYRPGVTGR